MAGLMRRKVRGVIANAMNGRMATSIYEHLLVSQL